MLEDAEVKVNVNNNRVEGLKAQLQRAGIKIESCRMDKNDRFVCTECVGGVTFVCFHCDKESPATEIQESRGDPAEHLCKGCYGTLTAKQWDEAVDALQEAHKYDYQ
jgi:hypothetical protein